jgi:hypothetical protein
LVNPVPGVGQARKQSEKNHNYKHELFHQTLSLPFQAYELSTLTGTQVMLLVASETGHVYTFATRKLQPMITSDAGKALIQTCLNSPDPPSSHGQGSNPGANPNNDQRMSQTGYEETELTYNIADEEQQKVRQMMYNSHYSPASAAAAAAAAAQHTHNLFSPSSAVSGGGYPQGGAASPGVGGGYGGASSPGHSPYHQGHPGNR